MSRHPASAALRCVLLGAFVVLMLPTVNAEDAAALTRAQKKAGRKELLRSVKKNPRVVLRSSFMRRAALFDFDLPVTFRLSRATSSTPTFEPTDDLLQLDSGSDPTAAPLPLGRFPGVVSTTLDGRIHATMRFGQDTSGYGRPGIIELGFSDFTLAGGSGLSLIDFDPACGDGPRLKAGPLTIAAATGANAQSSGYVDLFGGAAWLQLRTRWRFN